MAMPMSEIRIRLQGEPEPIGRVKEKIRRSFPYVSWSKPLKDFQKNKDNQDSGEKVRIYGRIRIPKIE